MSVKSDRDRGPRVVRTQPRVPQQAIALPAKNSRLSHSRLFIDCRIPLDFET